MLVARARDALVGVVMDASRLECARERVGVWLGLWLPCCETGRVDEVSSVMACLARLDGAVFSRRSMLLSSLFSSKISSLSASFALDWVRFKLLAGGANLAG